MNLDFEEMREKAKTQNFTISNLTERKMCSCFSLQQCILRQSCVSFSLFAHRHAYTCEVYSLIFPPSHSFGGTRVTKNPRKTHICASNGSNYCNTHSHTRYNIHSLTYPRPFSNTLYHFHRFTTKYSTNKKLKENVKIDLLGYNYLIFFSVSIVSKWVDRHS